MSSANTAIVAALAGVALLATIVGLLAYFAGRRWPSDSYHHYEQALADMQARLERTEQRSDRQQEQIDRLRDMLAQEQDYNRASARAMRDAGLEPPPRPGGGGNTSSSGSSDRAGLAMKIAECFSLDEIDDLAMELDMGVALTGDSLENRASSLVLTAWRRQRLSELVALCRRDRPKGGF
jgi:hypothetical protein